MTTPRSVNWVEEISRSLAANFPSLQPSAFYLTLRLSQRVLERLPPDIGFAMLALLPEALALRDPDYDELASAAAQQPDLTIGYPDLVEQAQHSLIGPVAIPTDPEFFEKVVDTFLWQFAQHISPELKHRISENLPVELRTRMNLYSGHVEESKVA